ncbi:hypothetical protein GCM10022415_12670 [Knoellia locipacati]|uniref:Uncharacterized protein n=1 Tax=Knoellia locipacati TaxID=882824 RepID=A0A512SZ46_9MICO|nr:YbaY family lipoprotein [Knoellia locipacati]GEQ13217.1 hypothetical protein KLO01_12640 [Knoellia locipacati]
MATVHVQIEWPDGAPLPEDPCARVTVEDVTDLDAASTVVAETVLEDLDPTAGPATTSLEVPEVDPASDLVVRVHVTQRDRRGGPVAVGDLLSMQADPVLTRGHGATVVVRPRVVGG